MNVGFIGLGNMGFFMCRNLLRNGYQVRAFDVLAEPAVKLANEGAVVASSPKDAAAGSDIIITMLPNGSIVEDVALGPQGLAEAMKPGALFIDMSTILPADSDRINASLSARGREMIDAPVGRTASEAESAKLLVMVGATPHQLERARPIFECLGDTIVHCGPAGAGSRMKLINNYMTTVSNIVTAEALSLAEKCGIDIQTALSVMRGTAAGRGHMNTTYPDKVLRGDLSPGFKIELARKDLALGLATGGSAGLALTTGLAALGVYDRAIDMHRGHQDWTAMLEIVPQLSADSISPSRHGHSGKQQ